MIMTVCLPDAGRSFPLLCYVMTGMYQKYHDFLDFGDKVTEDPAILWYTVITKEKYFKQKGILKMSVLNLNKNNFKETVNTEKTVLIDFWAPWCGPCRMVSPIVDEIAEENPDIVVGKVNVDDEGELAQEFGVMSIPTLIVMKNGKIVNQSVGAKPKAQILAMVK